MLAGRPAQQNALPLGGQPGVGERRLQLIHLRPLGRKVGLEWAAFQPIQVIPRLDLRAFLEQAFVQKRRDAGDDIDAIDGLDTAQKLIGLGDGALGDLDDAHGRGRCGWRLRMCLANQQCGNRSERDPHRLTHHRLLQAKLELLFYRRAGEEKRRKWAKMIGAPDGSRRTRPVRFLLPALSPDCYLARMLPRRRIATALSSATMKNCPTIR